MSWEREAATFGSVAGLPLCMGRGQNAIAVKRFGINPDVDIATVPESLWPPGAVYAVIGDNAVQLEIVSDDTSDTAGGSGARTVLVEGLDADWLPKSQLVEMDGDDEVTLSGTWRRVFSARVVSAGSQGHNDGVIDVQLAVSPNTIYCQIAEAIGQSSMCTYTVPAGKTGYVVGLRAGLLRVASTTLASLALYSHDVTNDIDASKATWVLEHEFAIGADTGLILPMRFTEKTDLDLRVIYCSADNTRIGGCMDLVIVDN